MRWENKLEGILGIPKDSVMEEWQEKKTADRVLQIKAKLTKLIQLDKEKKIFGAGTHSYLIKPKLTETELQQFEKLHKITIPNEYRLYLSCIGNGGAGPFYGLLPLTENDSYNPDLNADFPFTKENPLNLIALYDEVEFLLTNQGILNLDESLMRVENGIKILSHEGCGMYSILIMRGEEYGNVWYLDLANDAGAYPYTSPDTGGPMKFFEWLEIWLDRSIAEIGSKGAGLGSYCDFIV